MTALTITSFLATLLQGQRKQLVSDHQKMAYNLTAIFEGQKVMSSDIKNMKQPRAYIIWIGLGVIFVAIMIIGVYLLISNIKITTFLEQHFEPDVPDEVRGSKMPRVIKYSNKNKLVILQDSRGRHKEYGLPD